MEGRHESARRSTELRQPLSPFPNPFPVSRNWNPQPPALVPETWGKFPQTWPTVGEAWGKGFEAWGFIPQVRDSQSHIWGFVGEGWGFIPQAWGIDPHVSPRFPQGSPGCFRDTTPSFETWGKVGPASTTLPQASPLIPQVSPLNPPAWGNVGEVWGINPQARGKDFLVWAGVF